MNRSACFIVLMATATLADASPWTYRGTLNDGGKPANGSYDLRLTLVSESAGQTITQPITLFNIAVKDGNFTTDVDFGLNLDHAPPMKLKTEVAQGGFAFASIGEPTRFDPKAALAGICWDTTGNVVAAGEFLGSTNNVPIEFKANNQRVGSLYGAGSGVNVIWGWEGNTFTAGVKGATIGGGGEPGDHNTITGDYGTIAGGYSLRAGPFATVGGGLSNHSVGYGSVISGGLSNRAAGIGSMVAGGTDSCAGGDFSFAGGRRAKVRPGNGFAAIPCGGVTQTADINGDEGSFVWADAQDVDFRSTGPNQFLVRADGGLMLNTGTLANAGDDLVVAARLVGGDEDADVALVTRNGKKGLFYVSDATGGFRWDATNLTAGSNFFTMGNNASLSNGGIWTNASSRDYKEGFNAVNPLEILAKVTALPISTWTYKRSTEGIHLGPMAEDFKASFGLAGDGKSIGTVDADGVALAAIQGLNQKLEAESAELRATNASLQRQLDAVLDRLDRFENLPQR